jgi:acyl-coenzyme A synthetase/AMP-(fatty) acid ligase
MAANESSIPYGKRLLSATVDEIADKSPEKTFACISLTSNVKDGYRDVTFGDFARAVDRTAWWLEGLVGKSRTFETLAYIGPSDLRYFILMLAAPKVGYKVSRIS